MAWTAEYQFVSDDPLKVCGVKHGLYGSSLLPAISTSRRRLSNLSP